jgi:membrane-associated phospholipid phosphatase/tRNA A-37 threonylcarbamoyl transferase component Bud32
MDVENAVTSAAFRGLMGMTARDEARKPLPEMTVRQLLPFPLDPVKPATVYDDLPSAGTRPTHRQLGGQDPGLAARGRLPHPWTDPGGGWRALSDGTGRLAARGGPASVPPGPAVRTVRRQRRPTGAPPPLPHPVAITTTAWLVLVAVILAGAFVVSQHTPWLRIDDRVSTWLLSRLAAVRTPWLTDVADGIKAAGSGWGVTVLGLSVVALTMVFRRWRHLLVFLGSLLLLEIAGTWVYNELSRPRPYGVPIITSWAGYAGGAPPVAFLAIFLMGIVYCLAVPGRARTYAKAVAAAVVAVFGLARLYLGVDHPGDVLLGAAFAVAIAVTAFRFFTPNEVFPVAYRRGRTAHVDVTGRRGEAIRQAVRDRLGLDVTEIQPVGLESSAGSTPLRLRVEGGPDEFLFAKLYAKGHVRADRWYKLGRTILYGSLEDESPFKTVRRLAEYEDYALRLLQDAGVRTARPHGIVELTPEREYLLVTEFFEDAVEIGDAHVDDEVIDQGLALIRTLWDAGIAHRDIKPGNLMVRSGELLLIDVAFVQVLPSPWRQAVDLGNMMLVLAIRSDPQRVYRRALAYFTEAELAEAFAATRGVASPTQLRAFLKRDPRDLLGEFRALAPPRKPIVLQRWSMRRIALAAAVLGVIYAVVYVGAGVFFPAGNLGASAPSCGTGHSMILSAQAVPSAALLPCIAALPSGWSIGGADIASGHTRFWLDSDRAGPGAITVTLTATCDTSGARQIPSDQPGTRRFEHPMSLRPQFADLRFYTFPGGCATYRYSFAPGASPGLAVTADSALSFQPRSTLVDHIRHAEGLALCGRGAACPR